MPARASSLVVPPVAPMLGRLVWGLPQGEHVCETKWDGFRSVTSPWRVGPAEALERIERLGDLFAHALSVSRRCLGRTRATR